MPQIYQPGAAYHRTQIAYNNNQEFAPYEYREYPKAVTVHGVVHVVHSSDEEAHLTGSGKDNGKSEHKPSAPMPSVPAPDDKADLLKMAEEFGGQVDKRWSAKRIQEALEAASAPEEKAED